MPERDIFHDAVKNALIKEGWTITNDPLFIQFGGVDMYVDLGVEKFGFSTTARSAESPTTWSNGACPKRTSCSLFTRPIAASTRALP